MRGVVDVYEEEGRGEIEKEKRAQRTFLAYSIDVPRDEDQLIKQILQWPRLGKA